MFWRVKSRFKTLAEFYAAVDHIVAMLTAENYSEDARRLHRLLHEIAWTTSTELIYELLSVLKNMKGKYSPALSSAIKECKYFAVYHRQILELQ